MATASWPSSAWPAFEDTSRVPVSYDLDEPPVLLGNNDGSNPVEYLLVALSGCLTTSLVAHAAAKKILCGKSNQNLRAILICVGFLGISQDVPVGYQEIRIYFKIDADLSDTDKEELVRLGVKYSPVANTIKNQTPVVVQLEK